MNASPAARSITDTSIDWPGWAQIARVLSMRDYNTRIVVLGTSLLGLAAGVMGTYMLLRRRALIGDALAHATLPGIGAAFIVMASLGYAGKSLPVLLAGATITGLLGVGAILFIRSWTRIKEDAALGIVLSVFFGAGVALLGVIQKMSTGNAAGLESFIYGKTASMLALDAQIIAVAAAGVCALAVAMRKEFAVLSFDSEYAAAQGWPITMIDLIMMAGVTAVTVIGLQAVGLILIVAMLIIPAAAARFWTARLTSMLIVSAAIGAASGSLGAIASALVPRLPAGAIIVVTAATAFVISMVFGHRRGLIVRSVARWRLNRRVGRQHILRAIYEILDSREGDPGASIAVSFDELLRKRSWSLLRMRRLLRAARRDGLITLTDDKAALTERGLREATRIVRNHRLWEIYLITHADVAPSHVDRDADMIEHVLSPALISRLETLLAAQDESRAIPSPHALQGTLGTGATP